MEHEEADETPEGLSGDDENELSALAAAQRGSITEVYRICSTMSKTERFVFLTHVLALKNTLAHLDSVNCTHCAKPISWVPPWVESGFAQGSWHHIHSLKTSCDKGTTTAEPATPKEK